MKKQFACLLLVLSLLLCGCGEKEEAADLSADALSDTDDEGLFDPDEEDIWAEDFVPVETPAPTPVPVVDVNAYEYAKVNNKTLDVSFKYPSHWINVPGTYTISYEEPVEEGEIPSRISVTVKGYEGDITKTRMQQEAKDFSSVLSTTCDKYDRDKVTTDVTLMERSAYSFQYTGEIDGQDIHGFAIVGYDPDNHKLYAVNFYSVSKKFRHFDITRRVIINSLGRAS